MVQPWQNASDCYVTDDSHELQPERGDGGPRRTRYSSCCTDTIQEVCSSRLHMPNKLLTACLASSRIPASISSIGARKKSGGKCAVEVNVYLMSGNDCVLGSK